MATNATSHSQTGNQNLLPEENQTWRTVTVVMADLQQTTKKWKEGKKKHANPGWEESKRERDPVKLCNIRLGTSPEAPQEAARSGITSIWTGAETI